MANKVLVRKANGRQYKFEFTLRQLIPANRRMRAELSMEDRRKLGTAPKIALLLDTVLWEPIIKDEDDIAKIVIGENAHEL